MLQALAPSHHLLNRRLCTPFVTGAFDRNDLGWLKNEEEKRRYAEEEQEEQERHAVRVRGRAGGAESAGIPRALRHAMQARGAVVELRR